MAAKRKPKLLKKPKAPKASAPLDKWKAYEKKVIEVQKKNKDKMKPYEEHQAEKKKKTQIIQKIRSMGRI